MNNRTLDEVAVAMDQEGFDYCFRNYSDFDKVKDAEFHKLREAYIAAANALENYVHANSDLEAFYEEN